MPLFYTHNGFMDAAHKGDTTLVAQYLKKNKDFIRTRDKYGNSALHAAISNNHPAVTQQLLEAGADANGINNYRHTPMLLAVIRNNADIVKILLEHGASNGNAAGENPLVYHAAENGHLQALEALLAAKADPNGSRALPRSIEHRKNAAALMLLKAGANPEVHDGSYTYPIHFAAINGMTDMVETLLDKGADINQRQSSGYTALHLAALYGHNVTAEKLLARGADPDIACSKGRTARDYAYIKKNAGLARVLDAVTTKESSVKAVRAKQSEAPAAAPPPVAVAVAAADADTEVWVRMGESRVAHVGTYPQLQRKLTEIFNFSSRERLVITENLRTGAENTTPPESFDSLDEKSLAQALDRFTQLGGKADRDAILNPRGKKLRMP